MYDLRLMVAVYGHSKPLQAFSFYNTCCDLALT